MMLGGFIRLGGVVLSIGGVIVLVVGLCADKPRGGPLACGLLATLVGLLLLAAGRLITDLFGGRGAREE